MKNYLAPEIQLANLVPLPVLCASDNQPWGVVEDWTVDDNYEEME